RPWRRSDSCATMAPHADSLAPQGSPAMPLAWVRARHVPLTLGAVVLLGALFRFWNAGWDGGAYILHPDEWALNEVVRHLGSDLNPHFCFYGSFPIYLDRWTAGGLNWLTGQDWLAPARLPLIGRFYSALASTILLPLMFLVARRLWGTVAGLLAAAFTAC